MKKFLLSTLICILIGIACAGIIYKSVKKEEKIAINNKEESIYFLQVGAYKNYKNVNGITKTLNSYVVDEVDNTYFVFVAITEREDNLKKLSEFFKRNGNNIYVKQRKINNTRFLKKLKKYDSLLNETNDYETIKLINKEVLNKYKEELK